ncbi:putative phage tail protein [Methylophilus sp. YYY-1]|uniref:YmfQ family protein n=1 Tax=Methylophilus sp. YYY-1 TaxID=2682087 RepID=UPI0023B28405|nr:putative phage tail protein [Methylophilus sp. YYY-1]MDF0377705.1 DUF2313 domain-containing protein [Methylophilus sp. YYY-1]
MMHAELLKLLLPPVSYDSTGALLDAELIAEGNALDLAESSADQILIEADPRTTTVMFSDWERVYGLPEICVTNSGIVQSSQERRAALVAKVIMQGGQHEQFYIDLAASLGYTITITKWAPQNTEHDTEHAVTDEKYRFIWQVNSALNTIRELTTEDDTEMATEVWGNTLLECTMNRFKPGHTYIIFAYT